MARLLALALALAAAACAHAPGPSGGERLVVLYTGDGHGELGPCG